MEQKFKKEQFLNNKLIIELFIDNVKIYVIIKI